MICKTNGYILLFCISVLALPMASVKAEVVDVEELCVPIMNPGFKEGMHLMTTIKGETCDTRLYCSNFGERELSLRKVSVYHDCKNITVKFEPDSEKNSPSYYDFGNSLFSLRDKYQGLRPAFNTVFVQGIKVYLTAYGFDKGKKLISRVVRSIETDNAKRTNTDPHDSVVIHDRENGVFKFIQNDKKEELYFYKLVKCTKEAIVLPNMKGCFSKELVTY